MTSFSFKRLSLLIKKLWVENYRLWGMALGALIALYIIFHFLTSDRTHIIAFYPRQLIYSFGLVISGTIFANFLWRDFSTKGQGINFLLLPATPLEKLVAGIFYTSVVFPAVYISAFFLLDFAYVKTIKSVGIGEFDVWDLRPLSLSDPQSIVLPATIFFLMIQPIALMSSLLFEKFSYVKTALLVIILFLSFGYLSSFIRNITLREVIGDKSLSGSIFNLTQVNVNTSNEYITDTVSVPAPLSYFVNLTLTLGAVLFFTFITFLKLKEKEI